MSNKQKPAGGSIDLGIIVFLVLLIGKVFFHADITWFWVFFPLWIGFAIVFGFIAIVGIAAFIITLVAAIIGK